MGALSKDEILQIMSALNAWIESQEIPRPEAIRAMIGLVVKYAAKDWDPSDKIEAKLHEDIRTGFAYYSHAGRT